MEKHREKRGSMLRVGECRQQRGRVQGLIKTAVRDDQNVATAGI